LGGDGVKEKPFFTPCLLTLFTLTACSDENGGVPSAAPVRGAYLAMAHGEVDVEGGLIRIVAPRDGRVDAVAVEDGARVERGDVLVELDRRQAQIALDIAQANLNQAQAQAKVLETRLEPAHIQAQRLREAAGAGAASGQAADDAASALASLEAEAQAAQAAVKVAQQHVEEARVELDARTIRAPTAGSIVRRAVHEGDAVSAQAASELFQLLPDRPRIVRAELNEAYVDLIKVGMRAEVVRDADQDRTTAATVVRIGEVFGVSRLTDDPLERAGAHEVECVLHLEGGDFRIGQRVLVRFVRE
jgi:RND family efflux transporter MFP subunit